MEKVSILKMLSGFGITMSNQQEIAREELRRQKIIQGKQSRTDIASSKADRARIALRGAFCWHCNRGECRQAAQKDGRPLLVVQQSVCHICCGSPSARQLDVMSSAMLTKGLERILVVGGTNKKEHEILKTCSDRIQWRFIDGMKAKEDRHYQPNRDWADVILIWASTRLGHRTSVHFTRKPDHRVITVPRRGIASLCDEVIRYTSSL